METTALAFIQITSWSDAVKLYYITFARNCNQLVPLEFEPPTIRLARRRLAANSLNSHLVSLEVNVNVFNNVECQKVSNVHNKR